MKRPPTKWPRLSVLLPGFLVLAGCSMAINIQVDGSLDAPTFRVVAPVVERCVTSLSVLRAESPAPADALWSISSGPGCIRVDQMTYGIAPAGFRTFKQPQALEAGQKYTVRIMVDGRGGQIKFVYERGKYRVTP